MPAGPKGVVEKEENQETIGEKIMSNYTVIGGKPFFIDLEKGV
jgi:hypothetical protein